MERENYTFLKTEYDKQVAAFKAQLEKKYGAQKAAQQSKASINQKEAERHFKQFDERYGTHEKDVHNMKAAISQNNKMEGWIFDQEMQKELSKFEEALEKQMWKDYGGNRIEAKEKAFGPDDPEVKEYHQKLQKQQQAQKALEQARNAQDKSKLAEEFNKDKALQNQKEQQLKQQQGGRSR